MTRLLSAALAAVLLAAPAVAQDGPPSVLLSSWKCDMSAMGDILDMTRDEILPIGQALKDEGVLLDLAVLAHNWGDEWNYVMVVVAPDAAATIAGADALGERYAAQSGRLDEFLSHCGTHRDVIHRMAWFTQDDDDDGDPAGDAIALSHFACPLSAVAGIAEATREVMLPAAQASVDAGAGYFVGASTHEVADEWTFTVWRGAEDVPTLLAFNDDVNRRASERAGDRPNPMTACTAHKDNIYTLVGVTD